MDYDRVKKMNTYNEKYDKELFPNRLEKSY